MKKEIFNFDPANKAFTSSGFADESPLDEGGYLIPAFATEIPPPEIPAGKYAAFDGAAWQLLDATGPVPESISETPDQTIARYEAALDAHLDAVSHGCRYDNRVTFALRAGYPGPYQTEGIAFAQWMDACYVLSNAIKNAVLDGSAVMPSIAEFIGQMPTFNRP